VVRCIHRSGVIHEVGITFQKPIDIRDYVRRDPLADCFSLERVDPKGLNGTIVVIDPSEIDRRIFKHFLRETGLALHLTATLDDAMPLLDDACDLLIADLSLARDKGFFATVHHRCPVPVVIASSDSSDEVRQLLSEVPMAAFLHKPMTQRMLLRAIGEFLLVRGRRRLRQEAQPTAPDDEAPQLAQNFVNGLPALVAGIEKAVKAGDAAQCRAACLQIAGTAPAVGFKALGRLAAIAGESLSKSGSVMVSIHDVRSLVTACSRTSAATKAA
jgi:CheY-like chemotaxis protein